MRCARLSTQRKVNDLIQRLVNAIIRQEGMSSTYPNPGNLRTAPWLSNPKLKNGFWEPASRNEGVAGVAHVVALHIAEGNTLCELIANFAPQKDGNDTTRYILNVKMWAEILDENLPLYNFI